MSYVNNLKENNVVFDIQDKRIAQVSSSDADKVLRVQNDGSIVASNETKPKKVTISLPTQSWTGSQSPYSQTITIIGSTSNTKVDLQPDSTAIAQMVEDGTNAIYVENNNNTLTAYAVGDKPTVNLTVQGIIYEVVE